MSPQELDPEVFTADYTGTPGRREFFLQARGAFGARSFLVEKQQLAALAERLRELLLMVDPEDTVRVAEPARDPALAADDPGEPEWRVGTIGLAYDERAGRILVLMQPAGTDEASDPAGVFESEQALRLSLRPDQARAFVLHAGAVVAEGRPICQLCGLPVDPEGHHCPASNGHRRLG